MLSTPNAVSKNLLPLELNASLNNNAFNVQSSNYNNDTVIHIYASKPLSSSILKPLRYMRLIAVLSNAQISSGYDVYSDYVNVFRALNSNDKIYVGNKTVSLNSGYSNNAIFVNSTILSNSIGVNQFVFQNNDVYLFQDNNNFIFN